MPGLPVFAPATLPRDPQAMVVGGLHPSYDWTQLQAQGAKARPQPGTQHAKLSTTAGKTTDVGDADWRSHKMGMVDLLDAPRQQAAYWIGTHNFFDIPP